MKFVFFGSPRFAEIILEKLIAGNCAPSLVVTNPDRPFGRKKILTPPPVKVVAEKHTIQVVQPESLKNYKFPSTAYDFAVVAAYSKILPQAVIDLPRLGIIGVHPSLLPKYRGASPIQSALLHGEKETGVTLYKMDAAIDHGPMIARETLAIETNDTYETTLEKLANISGNLLLKMIPRFLNSELGFKEQDHDRATLTKKFSSEDGFVDPSLLHEAENVGGASAQKVFNMIRALNPEPGVWTMKDGKRMKLLKAHIEHGRLRVDSFQMEGKKPTRS